MGTDAAPEAGWPSLAKKGWATALDAAPGQGRGVRLKPMAQTTKGIRSILSVPSVYDALLRSLGSEECRRVFVDDHVRPLAAHRILDVGCGTGVILDFLPRGVDYLGIDLSAEYIQAATRRFGDRATFRVGDANELELTDDQRFDIIIAFGLLHHLEDGEVIRLAKRVRKLLQPEGRLVTFDNCFTDDQSVIARTLNRWDRGRNVRTQPQYEALIGAAFDVVKCDIRHDLLRIPYTHIILEAQSHP